MTWPVGLTIRAVEPLSAADRGREGWEAEPWNGNTAVALVLSDGSRLYASRDPEGNGPGALFGYADGEAIGLCSP